MGSAPTEGIGWLEGGGSVEGLNWTDRRDLIGDFNMNFLGGCKGTCVKFWG